MSKVTLKEIADQLGVSNSTVSRVLTNKGYVKQDKKAMIEKALIENGYKHVPHRNASESVEDLILVICGDLTHPVFMGYYRGISRTLEAQRLKVVAVDTAYDPAKEEQYLRYAAQKGLGGVIMTNVVETPGLLNLLNITALPVILMNRYLRMKEMDNVLINNFRGGILATEYLIRHGHKRISHLAGPANSTASADRKNGYVDAMQHHELQIDDASIYYGDLSYDSGYQFGLMVAKAKDRPTAVFSANDVMASGLVHALIDNGLKIPEDVSIICCDNTKYAMSGPVQLTTVSYDALAMGEAAADMLLERMQNKDLKIRSIV